MGTRAVFLYDFLNSKNAYESLGMLIEQNNWMVEDLIGVRNEYIEKVNPLVYKIEMLLHSMSTVNPAVRKIYEKFKIEGEY